MTSPPESTRADLDRAHLARAVLATFLFVFLGARIVVFLIMSRRMPDLYLHLGGTHVHHLNYGIFLLSGVGAYLVFQRPHGRAHTLAAVVYGAGLALTFDEFGMWVHLGGPYWQRASFDAVVVLAAFLALVAYAPALGHFRPHHWWTAVALVVALACFAALFGESFQYAGRRLGPRFEDLERAGPT